MVSNSRNLCLYPNVYLMDQFSSQIRTYRPLAVNKTEVTIYCIAPKGESAEARTQRIRQYEDFFNATGMATPDDLEEFRVLPERRTWPRRRSGTTCPAGSRTGSRGRTRGRRDRSEAADEWREDRGRGTFTVQHQYWHEAMKQALDCEHGREGESCPQP